MFLLTRRLVLGLFLKVFFRCVLVMKREQIIHLFVIYLATTSSFPIDLSVSELE